MQLILGVFAFLAILILGIAGLDLIIEGHLPFIQIAFCGIVLTIAASSVS